MKIANSKHIHHHAVPVVTALVLGTVVSAVCALGHPVAATGTNHAGWQALVSRSVAFSPSKNGWSSIHAVTTQSSTPEKATRLDTAALVPESAVLHIAVEEALISTQQ